MSDHDKPTQQPSLTNIPAGLAVHATAGMLVTLRYASCFWSTVLDGIRFEQARREERK